MKARIIIKFAAILLIWAGSFSSCGQGENSREELSPCDISITPYGILPWVYEFIGECLEGEFQGRMYKCEYTSGTGFILESYESADTVYSFLSCEGTVLYEREEKPIEATYPELKIKKNRQLFGKFASWENQESSDEFVCNAINPLTLPRVKEMIYGCTTHHCVKEVSICTYKDGVSHLKIDNNLILKYII